MSDPTSQRKKLYVDSDIQGALVRRVLLYWLSCLLFMTVPVVIARTLADPDRLFYEHLAVIWRDYWPVLSAAVLMLPFLTYDIVRLSHRFVGPLFRLRREMARMAAGEAVEPLTFRDNDYWQDLADSFSSIVERVGQIPPAEKAPESPARRAEPFPPVRTPEPVESA